MMDFIHWLSAQAVVLAVLVAVGVALLLACCLGCSNCSRSKKDDDDVFTRHEV